MKKYDNKLSLLLFLLVSTFVTHAQTGRQNLYFVKNNRDTPSFGARDYKPSAKGFYLYRNCIYDIVLNTKERVAIRVIDIQNDSIYFIRHLYVNPTNKRDTGSLHPTQIKKIKLIGDRMFGLYSTYGLKHYRYAFTQDTGLKKFDIETQTVHSPDSTKATTYEAIPFMTAQGVDYVYEQCGVTYYYRGTPSVECKDTTPSKEPIRKKGVWFTPTNANEIKGVNIGIQTMNAQAGNLHVRGVNLNADALSFLLGSFMVFAVPFHNELINMEDSIDVEGVKIKVEGLSLSVGGLVGNTRIKGLSFNGVICSATESRGLIITGSQNIIDDFNGMEMSLLRNRSTRGKGVQLGLLNVCKHMKGIQVGLWNVNSKRRLPFINWDFKGR